MGSAAESKRRDRTAPPSDCGVQFDPSVCNLNDRCAPELGSIDAVYEDLLKNGASLHKDVSRFQASVAGPAAAKAQSKPVEHFSANLFASEKRKHYQAV